MRILAIETSCDETAIAILEVRNGKFEVRSNVVLSQIKIHKPFGGVVPNLAKREHQKNLPVVLKQALKEAKTSPQKIDAIAVTYGPGLEPALWMGINFAKELAEKWKRPIIPVNHLEGHIYASWLPPAGAKPKSQNTNSKQITKHKNQKLWTMDYQLPTFPLLALIVSGGHTELILMKKHLDYKIFGETLDDAAGEAFDKVARLLKLGYPGGPSISKLASKYLTLSEERDKSLSSPPPLLTKEGGIKEVRSVKFPRPMINSPDLNFSFSGLKTAVFYYLRDNPNADKSAVAYEFQQAVIDVLIKKTTDAIKKYKPKSLVVGGGVAANKALRHALEKLIKFQHPTISLHISPLWLTGDNAAMIAAAAYFKLRLNNSIELFSAGKIKARGNLRLGQ